MFKKIPGNTNYLINLEGKVIGCNEAECTLPICDGKINISLFGKQRWVDLKWLSLVAWYEVFFPIHLERFFFSVRFTEISDEKNRFPKHRIMMFERPIEYKKKYRIIPCFPNYAVSSSAEVIDVHSEKVLHVTAAPDAKHYPSVDVYDPLKGKKRAIGLHRLVALAWVKNEDWLRNNVVNHLDGNKDHSNATNLEWTNYSNNAIHAFKNNLREDNRPCKIRDFLTGEIKEFYSVNDALKSIGASPSGLKNTKTFHLRPTKLINGRYELRRCDDNRPWFYEGKTKIEKNGRYQIDVKMPDGTELTFHSTVELQRTLKLWNCSTVYDQKKRALEMYPGIEFNITEHYVWGKNVQAYKVDTGEIFEDVNIKALAKQIGVNWTAVRAALHQGETKVLQGYAYRRSSDKPWDTDFTFSKFERKCIYAKHSISNEIIEFDSLRDTAKHFKVDRAVIKLRMERGTEWNHWKFENKQ